MEVIDSLMWLLIVGLVFLMECFKVLIPVWLINISSRSVQPSIIRLLNLDKSNKHSTADFFSYELAVLIIAPIIYTVSILFLGESGGGAFNSTFFKFLKTDYSFLTYYAFSLTLWKYDRSLKFFQRVTKKQVVVNAVIIFGAEYFALLLLPRYFSFVLSLILSMVLIVRNRMNTADTAVAMFHESEERQ